MSDLIDRQAAIDAAIEAADKWDGGYSSEREGIIRKFFDKLPAVQADHIAESDRKVSISCGQENDLIFRKAAIDAVVDEFKRSPTPAIRAKLRLEALPSAAPSTAHTTETTAETTAPSTDDWIPVERELPEDLAEVNVTWVNHEPEPYYESIKSKPFTASAVYYEGNWYWYSSVCADVLAEYGRNDVDKVDDAIEITAWRPFPEPYRGGGE